MGRHSHRIISFTLSLVHCQCIAITNCCSPNSVVVFATSLAAATKRLEILSSTRTTWDVTQSYHEPMAIPKDRLASRYETWVKKVAECDESIEWVDTSFWSLDSVMSLVQHLVSPKLPTSLANDTHVDLPGQDAWILYLENVYVVPTVLDTSRFEDALSRVLQLYPHAAGQLRHTDGCWSIELTNTPVPVDVDYKRNVTSDSLLSGDWVIQDDLSPFLSQQSVGTNLVNGSASLLRFRLTLFDHETCIGVSWSHSLGDAIMIMRLMHMLSQFYQNLPPGFAEPTFKKHHYPMPSVEAELSAPLHQTRHFDEAAFFKSQQDLEHVRWRFDSHELEELRSALGSDGQKKRYLSKQDCLTAYLVAIFNHSGGGPVQMVTTVCSYRHISASFIAENVAGCSILHVSAHIPKDVVGIASAVRDALIQSREPQCLYILESLKSKHMLEAANAGKLLPYGIEDDELLVNSNVVIDWCSADFGCPDGVRFYTHGVFGNVLRCFKSNPVKGEDGAWRARQSIEVGLGIPGKLKPNMVETLTRGIPYMLDNQHVRL